MQDSLMEIMRRTSHLSGGNVAYIEQLYESYLEDANSVPEEWRAHFEKLPRVDGAIAPDVPHAPIRTHFELLGRSRNRARPVAMRPEVSSEHEKKQVRVLELISAYRHRGHKRANIDPLGLMERPATPVLDLAYHRLSDADLDTVFQTGSFFFGDPEAPLKEIIKALEATYCGTVGAEFMHIMDEAEKLWVQQRLESVRSHPDYAVDVQKMIAERLTAAEGLEKYLHNRYPGTKRFGLEGGEAMIPAMHECLQRAGSHGIVETVIGMAHRGRLNVLVNILGKQPEELFDEFEGKVPKGGGSGDVKYHQGFSCNVMTPGGEMHVALSFNPSHLEIVNPVVEGSVRARQDRRLDYQNKKVLPLLIHGDAAIAGQGVVMETFQMSQTRGFRTGGTIHVVINNQVGFTMSRQDDARSTEYCTEVAKMVQAPILHVNGDDPEAVVFAMQLAVDYRMEFHKDVVIDLVCYRRRGHNEAEEPAKTQPQMYTKIRKHPTTRTLYVRQLVEAGVIKEEDAEVQVESYRDALDTGRHVALSLVSEPDSSLFVDWRPYLGHEWTSPCDTRFELDTLQRLANQLLEVPEGFVLHRQVEKLLEDRRKMTAGAMPINWGYAETMAYATLLHEEHPVRLTGQDSGVGTFSHRHATLYDQKTGKRHIPLNHLSELPTFDIYDSLLSEEAVLAFEYGYATTMPTALVIWEAQFGDFVNGAQVVIDQFIVSGEHKWQRLCGLTMLLPHGYEGAGPEHSSARLERFLQLCAEHNIQVCVPTTPAQVFHMLRRQVKRPLRKPLVVMTPKSLLRHKLAVSTLEDLCDGSFQTVIGEVDALEADNVERVVMCSGKVYYDLLQQRRDDDRKDVAIVRIEQLYPFPEEELAAALAPFKNTKDVVWCQEEPMNQGAWYPSQHHMRRVIHGHNSSIYLRYAGRDASAAPAAGYMSVHLEQQERLVKDALYG
ncbi:MAG: 2-oxoglutarate dehydrogenase E1 component [Gammaproteobacteria bacterium]|nr:MAG: 2-oxoglutarate dehydrogenase E1 component [Gammaproteobacteria bacterium]